MSKNDQDHRQSQGISGDLLATKLVVPVIGTKIVRRNRLTNLIQQDAQHKVTLIMAPAGYGKTTLLGELASSYSEAARSIAWLSLDVYDNDPLRFWTYVVTAIQKVYPGFQFDILKIFYGQCDSQDCTYINPLLNAIAQIPQDITLILDDYHTIQNQTIHQGLEYFIYRAPGNFYLIISSRTKPPIPISKLRVRRQLLEITAKDLSFTFSEAEVFLSSVMELEIDREGIASLLKKTEGWIASLHLAALSLQDQQDKPGFISEFAGSHRHILEYLVEEILRHLDGETIDFLLKTSVLNELSAPLCDFVLDRKDSWRILSEIERSKLFIIPLNEFQSWYRYHSLFAEALQVILKHRYPELIPQLYIKASMWHRENGNPESAVPYALAAGDLQLAAEIVDDCAMQALIEFDLIALVSWINRFSEELIRQRPRLGIVYALANYNLGRMNLIEPMLQVVEQALDHARGNALIEEDEASIRREIKLIRAAMTCIGDDCDQGISVIEKEIDSLPNDDSFYYGFLNHYMDFAYESAGNYEAAATAFKRGSQFALRHSYPMEHVYSQCELARIRKIQGRLYDAREIYREALDFAIHSGLDMGWIIHPQAGIAETYLEQNDLISSEYWLRDAMNYYEIVDKSNYSWVYSATLALCSRLVKYQLACGDIEKARYYYQKFQDNIERSQLFSQKLGDAVDIQVRLWRAKAGFETFARQLKEKAARSGGASRLTASEQIAIARIYLAEENPKEALGILESLEKKVRDSGAVERLIVILCLKALARKAVNTSFELTRETIYQALEVGATRGYLRIFVDEGEELRDLLEEVLVTEQGEFAQSEYIKKILAAFEMKKDGDHPSNKVPARQPDKEIAVITPVENTSLSDREIEVVRLWVEGYSKKEVALCLVISTNTVKAHIKKIYKSLGVHTRRELIYRAKEMGIV